MKESALALRGAYNKEHLIAINHAAFGIEQPQSMTIKINDSCRFEAIREDALLLARFLIEQFAIEADEINPKWNRGGE